MSSAELPEHITVEQYLATEKTADHKCEYVDGWVRAMSGGSNRHNQVKVNCVYHLMRQLRGGKCRPFDSDTKLRIIRQGSTRFYYPDVQVICEGNLPTEDFQDSPVVVIEVLSNSTRRYDLDEKLTAYLGITTLQCYIVLEQHTPTAIILRRSGRGFFREVVEGVEAAIDLPFLNCRLLLSELYEGIEFTPTCVQEVEGVYQLGAEGSK